MKKIIAILFLISLSAFSISFEKIGEWGFGKYQQIAMNGDIVYGISQESGISVIDFSDINNPVKLGEFSRTEEFHNMLIDGNTAFISAAGKIFITDISNNIPQTISIMELDADCYRMAKVDNKLYIAGGYAGLIVLDVSDLEHPSVLGTYLDVDNMKNVVDVAVNTNGDIYVIDKETGLFILKTSDFQTYEEIGRMQAQMFRIKFVSDTEIALSYGQNGIKFYNCENPDSLKYIGGYTEVNFISDFILDGTVMYCADSYNGLIVLDITSTGTPSLLKNVPTSTICYSIVKKDNYIFSANSSGGILCFDVSDPAQTAQVSSFDDSSFPVDMAFCNGKLVIADFYNGIKTLSVDDVTNLQILDLKRGKDFPSSVAVKDDYVYYADSTLGIGVFKLNSDGSLSDINYIDLSGNFLDIEIYGDYLLCAGEYGGLYLFDISDRENPQLLDVKYQYQSVVKARVDENGLIVVSLGLNGVKLCTMENNELIELASIVSGGYAIDSLFVNSMLFVADFYNGLRVFTLDENYNIVSSDILIEGEAPESLFVDGDFLYVACGSKGMYVISLASQLLEQVAYIETYSNAKKVVVQDGIMFVAEGLSGKIDVFRIVDSSTNVYTAPLNKVDNVVEVRNNGATYMIADLVVYNNLKPVQFERVELKPESNMLINLEHGDVLKCFSSGPALSFNLLAGYSGTAKARLPLSFIDGNRMRGILASDSFYQKISIENTSAKNGYFTIAFFNSEGSLIFSKSVFVEAGDSREFTFMFFGFHSFEIRGETKFTATLYQRGIFETDLSYLHPVRLESY